jgi:hypothetical protein
MWSSRVAFTVACVVLLAAVANVQAAYTGLGDSGCSAGTYDNGGFCTICPRGSYSMAVNSSACTNCTGGSTSTANRDNCVVCDAGSFSDGPGSVLGCQLCPAGKFSGATNMSWCAGCPAGTYSSAAGSSVCTNCAVGSYQPGLNSTTCLLADYNNYVNTTRAVRQITCPPGSVANGSGNIACITCGNGSYMYIVGQDLRAECRQCAAGTYNYNTTAISCTQTPAGSFSLAGAAIPTLCANGTFSAAGAAACTPAPAGSFAAIALTDSVGSTAATQCAAGYYSPAPGAVACTICAKGWYSAAAASTTCTACARGKFASSQGATTCTEADPGSFVPAQGSDRQQTCGSGTVSADSASAACTQCDAGTQASSDQTACTACLAGSANPTAGGSCASCVFGFYQPDAGATTCLRTTPGKYSVSPFDAQTTCPTSPVGITQEVAYQCAVVLNATSATVTVTHPSSLADLVTGDYKKIDRDLQIFVWVMTGGLAIFIIATFMWRVRVLTKGGGPKAGGWKVVYFFTPFVPEIAYKALVEME